MRWLGVLILGAAACFSNAPPLTDESTSGGPECPVGSEGCRCTGGGGCDSPLVCHPQSSKCQDPDCIPGAGACECDGAGTCEPGFECVDEFCSPVGSDSDSVGTADADATGNSTTPVTSGPDMTTGPMATQDSGPIDTGANEAETATDPTSASMGSTTGELTCGECVNQAAMNDSCMAALATCIGCGPVLACVVDETDPQACCAMHSPPVEWEEFAGCAETECAFRCGSIKCVGG